RGHHHLPVPRVSRGRWSHQLWNQYRARLSRGRRVCRPYPARHQAGGSPSGAADGVRAGDQSQERQSRRARPAGDAARPRRRGDRMNRRAFITLMGGAAVWPLAVRAQQATPVVGMLSLTGEFAGRLQAFHQGLSETGYDDGRNVTIENSWDGRYDRLPAVAAELARRRVSVIVATSTPGARAAKAATLTVPLLFSVRADPIE